MTKPVASRQPIIWESVLARDLTVIRALLLAISSILWLMLAACDILPSDGPNANTVTAGSSARVNASTAVTRYVLVTVNDRISQEADRFYRPSEQQVPAEFPRGGSFGRVGVGDLLRVTVWETGEVGLFSGRDRRSTDISVRVDTDGTIALPYAGRFAVAGRRLSEVEGMIVSKLTGQAVQPQATVVISENVSSSVSVQGDVLKPGPYPVVKADQRVLDMIAMAGGAKYAPYETTVRLTRGRSTMATGLQDVLENPGTFNLPVSAGDTLLLVRSQQKFLAFGAVVRPGEQTFLKSSTHLSDGLGQVMGLDPNRSDAKGVYLFRREPVELLRRYGFQTGPEDGADIPIVYQLDLKSPNSFFVLNSFPMRANDILYVSTSPLADAARFFQILSGATNTVAIPRTLLGNYPAGQ
jgi:polysaccharide export outer membrane protein